MKRNNIGIISALVVIFEAFIIGILTMVRTRVLIDVFGSASNGVVQLSTQFASYALLFESGLTAAYQFSMYKPLLNNDSNSLSKLYSGMLFDLKKISLYMFICVLVVTFVYSFFIINQGISYIEIFSILIVMGMRLVSPYLFTVSIRTMLIVKEKKYLTDIIETIKNSLGLIIEIVLIKITTLPLFIILSFQILLNYIVKYIYQFFINKLFNGELIKTKNMDRSPRKMTSDILVHKISGLINSNTDTVLLSVVKSRGLNSVTCYTSFYTLINYPVTLVVRIIDGIRASIALKINENKVNAYSYFREMFSFSRFCILIVIPIFIFQANDFISLWLGNEYSMSCINIVFFALIAIHQMLIPVVYAIRDSMGLYKESKYISLFQAIINMIISVILVKPLGILGVLIGTVVADWFVLEPFNVKLVFKEVFFKRFNLWGFYLSIPIVIFISLLVLTFIKKHFFSLELTWKLFFIRSILLVVVNSVIVFCYLIFSDCYFKDLLNCFIKHRR